MGGFGKAITAAVVAVVGYSLGTVFPPESLVGNVCSYKYNGGYFSINFEPAIYKIRVNGRENDYVSFDHSDSSRFLFEDIYDISDKKSRESWREDQGGYNFKLRYGNDAKFEVGKSGLRMYFPNDQTGGLFIVVTRYGILREWASFPMRAATYCLHYSNP